MLSPGDQVGKYVVERHVASGAMADVYRVRHVHLGSAHALKVLNAEFRHRPEVRERFLVEGQVAARLRHPNIVGVTDTVATDDTAGLVMELVDGPDLDEYIQGLAVDLDADQIRRAFVPVLRAVGFAHQHGIIHRDLKPANVLLERDGTSFTPRVTDFGIAKVTDAGVKGRKRSTHIEARMGTLNYMSPEQIRRSKEVTVRSDVFSLGAVLYELATRRMAFDADNDLDLMNQVVAGDYVDPSEHVPGIDARVAAAIECALRVNPLERFASCEEFEHALTTRAQPALLPEDPGSDRPAFDPTVLDLPEAPSPRRSRNGLVLALALVAVIATVGGGLYVASKVGKGDEVRRSAAPAATTAPGADAATPAGPDASTHDVVANLVARHADAFGSGAVAYAPGAPVIGPAASRVTDIADMERSIADGEGGDVVPAELLRGVPDGGASFWLVFDLVVGTRQVRVTEVAERTPDGWRVVAAHWSAPQLDSVTNPLARRGAIRHEALAAGTASVGPLADVYDWTVANIGDAVSSKPTALMLGSQDSERVYGGENVQGVIAAWKLRLVRRGPGVTGVTADGSIGWALGTVAARGNRWDKPYRLMVVYEKAGAGWEVVHLHFSVTTDHGAQ